MLHRKLLLVTANFPPTNAVDCHRIRISLPYYREFGYSPSVLCFHPDCTDHPKEALLRSSVPADTPISEIQLPPARYTRRLGIRSVAFRGWMAMRSELLHQIRKQRPDLVLFSTTSFPLMSLGPNACSPSGVPFVLDFQDPWVAEEGSCHKSNWKHRTVRQIHRFLEPRTVPKASGWLAVSQGYLDVLRRRYPRSIHTPAKVVPFGWSQVDLDIARREYDSSGVLTNKEFVEDCESKVVGLYAGAYVPTMRPMIGKLFRSVRQLLAENPMFESLRLWFIGSNYHVQKDSSPILSLASEYGIQRIIREQSQRIPYYEAQFLLTKSHFNLLFGSASRGYNPSKLLGLLATGTQLLGIVQANTFVSELLDESGSAKAFRVSMPGVSEAESSDPDLMSYLTTLVNQSKRNVVARPEFLRRYSAKATTEQQSSLFDEVLRRHQDHGAYRAWSPGVSRAS